MSDINRLERKYTKEQLIEMTKENDADYEDLKAILETMRERGHPLPDAEKIIEDIKVIHDRSRKMLGGE